MKRILLAIFGAVVLNGCGGGSGGFTADKKIIHGKILDGYITGASIFWDCNANSKIDESEVLTTSTGEGVFSILPSPKKGCRLTAIIPASAIDTDNNASVLMPYTMYALESNNTIISPLTTLAVLADDGSGQAVSTDLIRQKLELTLALDKDYIADTTAAGVNSRKFAKVTAQLLQDNFSTSSQGYDSNSYKTILDVISSKKETIKISSLTNVLNKIIDLPLNFRKRFSRFFYADPSLGVKVNPSGLTEIQISRLNEIIIDPEISTYIKGGVIDWKSVPVKKLEALNARLNTNGFTFSQFEAMRTEWLGKKAELNAKYSKQLNDSNPIVVLDAESIGAMFDIADSMIKGGYGVAKMASIAPNLTGVISTINITPGTKGRLIKNLDTLSKYTAFSTKVAACGFSIKEFRKYFESDVIEKEDYLLALHATSNLIGCLGSLVDDAPVGKGVEYVVNLFNAGSSSLDERFEATITLLETVNIVISMTPPSPFSNFVSGFIDVTSAAVNSYQAGITLSQQAGKKFDIAKTDIDKLYQAQNEIIDREYFARFIQNRVSNKIVRADWILEIPVFITSLTPIGIPALAETVTFSLVGTNFPSVGNFNITSPGAVGCTNLQFLTSSVFSPTTRRDFSCIPNAYGAMTIEVRDVPFGNLLFSNTFNVQPSFTPTTTTLTTSTFTVLANTIPGAVFTVPAGATSCKFDATGTWSTGANAPISSQTADGAVGGNSLNLTSNGVPIPAAPNGALVARRSSNLVWQLIGSSQTIDVTGIETVTFMMNDATDNGYTNGNTGQLAVTAMCRLGSVTSPELVQSALFDDFTGTAIDTNLWNINIDSRYSTAVVTTNAGETTFGNCTNIDSSGKKTFSGSKIIVEARFKTLSTGGGHEGHVDLVDFSSSNYISLGQTNYGNIGLYSSGSGIFALGQSGNGTVASNGYKEYRLTIEGTNLKIERGDTLTSITETLTRTLPSTMIGKTFYVRAGTGCEFYYPAIFDWIRVTTTP